MFMCFVHRKSVNKLDLTWKQSFLILVDSELFRWCSLYQFELILKRPRTFSSYFIQINTVNISYKDYFETFLLKKDGEPCRHSTQPGQWPGWSRATAKCSSWCLNNAWFQSGAIEGAGLLGTEGKGYCHSNCFHKKDWRLSKDHGQGPRTPPPMQMWPTRSRGLPRTGSLRQRKC